MTKEQLTNLSNDKKQKHLIGLNLRIERLQNTKEKNKARYNHYFSEGMDDCINLLVKERDTLLSIMNNQFNT